MLNVVAEDCVAVSLKLARRSKNMQFCYSSARKSKHTFGRDDFCCIIVVAVAALLLLVVT